MEKELEQEILELWRRRSKSIRYKQEGLSEKVPRAKFMVLPNISDGKGNTYISILVEGIVLESVIDYRPEQFQINGIIKRWRNRDKLMVIKECYLNRSVHKKYNERGILVKEIITYD